MSIVNIWQFSILNNHTWGQHVEFLAGISENLKFYQSRNYTGFLFSQVSHNKDQDLWRSLKPTSVHQLPFFEPSSLMPNSFPSVLLKHFPDILCLLASLGFSAWSAGFLSQPLQSWTLPLSSVESDRSLLNHRALLQPGLELHSPPGAWQSSEGPWCKAHQSYMPPPGHSESIKERKEQ